MPESWWRRLGKAKAAGLVAGLFVPPIGVAAGAGLVLYFLGAVVTVAHARSYSHLAFPVLYLAPVVTSLAAPGSSAPGTFPADQDLEGVRRPGPGVRVRRVRAADHQTAGIKLLTMKEFVRTLRQPWT